jgi:hypothetical protein
MGKKAVLYAKLVFLSNFFQNICLDDDNILFLFQKVVKTTVV